MKIRSLSSLIFVPVIAVLTSCSAKIDGSSIPNSPAPAKKNIFDRAAIAGPDVVGLWQADCVADPFQRASSKASIQFLNATDFNYNNVSYSDYSCKTAVKTESHKGVYQFSEKLSETLFRIDYNYLMNDVTYRMDGQRLEFDVDTIYISEFSFGNVDVDHTKPFKKVAGATDPGAPVQAPVTACQDYSGTYQMNSDNFRIEQTACSKVVWVWLPTFGNPNETRVEYVADGQSHDVGGKLVTAAFNAGGQFTLALKTDAGDPMVKTYSFQQTPCHLANPSGENYLTRDVTINGVQQFSYCAFWTRH
jgi:hypothetical protein